MLSFPFRVLNRRHFEAATLSVCCMGTWVAVCSCVALVWWAASEATPLMSCLTRRCRCVYHGAPHTVSQWQEVEQTLALKHCSPQCWQHDIRVTFHCKRPKTEAGHVLVWDGSYIWSRQWKSPHFYWKLCTAAATCWSFFKVCHRTILTCWTSVWHESIRSRCSSSSTHKTRGGQFSLSYSVSQHLI